MSGGKYFEEPKVNNSGNNVEARNLEAESIQRNTTDLSRYQTLKNQAMTKYESVKGNTQNDKVKYNKALITNKALLESLMVQYRDELADEDADDLDPIFLKIQQYIDINKENTTVEETRKEQKLFRDAINALQNYSLEIMNAINSQKNDDPVAGGPEAGVEAVQEPMKNTGEKPGLLDRKMEMAANLAHFMEVTGKGDLVVPPKAHVIRISNKTKFETIDDAKMVDKRDLPLFTHDPSFEDVQQGGLGDCYFLSALSKVAAEMPEKIREAMVDNLDGTVTVRFYTRGPVDPKYPDMPRVLTPVYVTVDKEVPESGQSKENLWVQLYEKAYAASGIRLGNALSGEAMPENIEELYQYYLEHPAETPSYLECPWLVNPDGTLHPWNPRYTDVEAGFPSEAIETLLGMEYRGVDYDMKQAIDSARFSSKNAIKHTSQVWARALKMAFLEKDPNWQDVNGYFDVPAGSFSVTPMQIQFALYEYLSGQHIVIPGEPGKARSTGAYNSYGIISANWESLMGLIGINYFDMGKSFDPDDTMESFLANNVEQLIKDSQDPEYKNILSKLMDDEKEEISQHLEYLQGLKRVGELLAVNIAKVKGMQYSGLYNDLQDRIWNNMKSVKDKGGIVNAGTFGESAVHGMQATHAYTIVDMYTKNMGGKELRFVKMRNPWGEHQGAETPQYSLDENNNVQISYAPHNSDGTFDLELSDFMAAYANIYYNGKEKDVKRFRSKDELRTGNITVGKKTATDYADLIYKLDEELRSTDSSHSFDSEEYKNLRRTLSQLRRSASEFYFNRTMHISSGMSKLKSAAEKYLEHCKNSTRLFSSRRDNRVRIAESIVQLAAVANSTNSEAFNDPKKEVRKRIADKLYDGTVTLLGKKAKTEDLKARVVANKQNVINAVLDNPEFKKKLDSISYSQAYALTKQEPADLLKFFENVKLDPNTVFAKNHPQPKREENRAELNDLNVNAEIVQGEDQREIFSISIPKEMEKSYATEKNTFI